MCRKTINTANPFWWTTSHHVPRIGGKNVSIAQHQVTRPHQRDQMPLVAIREIRRMDQAEGRGCQQFPLFALAGGCLDDLRRVPLAEVYFQALELEPAFKKINLCGFPRPVETLHCYQSPGKTQF